MPAKSAEQIKQKAQALRKKIAEKGTALTEDKVRAMKKKVRRLQRRPESNRGGRWCRRRRPRKLARTTS